MTDVVLHKACVGHLGGKEEEKKKIYCPLRKQFLNTH